MEIWQFEKVFDKTVYHSLRIENMNSGEEIEQNIKKQRKMIKKIEYQYNQIKSHSNQSNMYPQQEKSLTLSDFYFKVIDSFGKKLFQKYHQKQQGFDSQMIDQITKRVTQKMQNPQYLFHKALEIRHCSSASKQLVIQKKTSQVVEVKKQYIQPHHMRPPMNHNNHHPTSINITGMHEQQPDYAIAFDVHEGEVKKQEADENGIIKHEPKNEDLQDEKDEQDEREKRDAIEKVKNNLVLHIVGTYEPKSKKHVAKDESTKLDLDNVFIKCKNNNRFDEVFVPKLQCQFKKE